MSKAIDLNKTATCKNLHNYLFRALLCDYLESYIWTHKESLKY